MVIALDSYYQEDMCNTSMVAFDNLYSYVATYTDAIYTKVTSEYIPGQFYKRELPGMKKILHKFKVEHPEAWKKVDLIIVDSFVYLATEWDAWGGLGWHLYYHLRKCGNEIPVMGVAKTNFGTCDKMSKTKCVRRGNSYKPLYVQTVGTSKGFDAAKFLQHMHGSFRIPTMLKEVDRLSRIFK